MHQAEAESLVVCLPAVMSEVHTSPSTGDLCWGLFSGPCTLGKTVSWLSALFGGYRQGVWPPGPGEPHTGGAWSRSCPEGLNLSLLSRKMPPGSVWGGAGGLGVKVPRGRLLTPGSTCQRALGSGRCCWRWAGEPVQSPPEEADQELRRPDKAGVHGGWGPHLKLVGMLPSVLAGCSSPSCPDVDSNSKE